MGHWRGRESFVGGTVEARLGPFWPLTSVRFIFPSPDQLPVRVTCRYPGVGRRQTAPASSPAPECGPRQTPVPRLASWGFTWYIRTQGMLLSSRIQALGNCMQETSTEKGSSTHVARRISPPWPRPPLGSSGRRQAQRPKQETHTHADTLFQPRVLAS